MTKVNFKWSQQIDSYHPDFSITATFEGLAEIKDINANEIEVKSCSVRWDGALASEPVSVTRGDVGIMQNFFLGKCREAARSAYQKMQDAALQAECLKSNHHNANYWPSKNVYRTSFEDMANDNGGGGKSAER